MAWFGEALVVFWPSFDGAGFASIWADLKEFGGEDFEEFYSGFGGGLSFACMVAKALMAGGDKVQCAFEAQFG